MLLRDSCRSRRPWLLRKSFEKTFFEKFQAFFVLFLIVSLFLSVCLQEDLDELTEYLRIKLGTAPYGDEADKESLVNSLKRSSAPTQESGLSAAKLENEVDILREEIRNLTTQHTGFKERYKRDMNDVKNLLLEVLSRSSGTFCQIQMFSF